jgi:hypothetical protein
MATAYQKRMMLRKQSDLTRLADQYRKNVEGLTGEYQSAFANYQKSAAEQLAPYEEAVRRYKEQDMPAFERAKADYESRLEQFNQAMADYEANPTERVNARQINGRGGPFFEIDGKRYNSANLPAEYSVEYVDAVPAKTLGGGRGAKVIEPGRPASYEVYRDRAMPKMRGSAPKAPSAPERPAVADFDSSQFEKKRGQLQQDYTREVGERKGAKLNAVRRTNRTLMRDA